MRNLFLVPCIGWFAFAPLTASAHAFLVKADPPVGSVVRPMTTVTLEFSEAIELALSGAELSRGAGGDEPLMLVFTDESHRRVMGKVPLLMAGSYRVKWHVVSADTHRTEGSFTFTVRQ